MFGLTAFFARPDSPYQFDTGPAAPETEQDTA
jgi:hypothetical protein